jgi:phosphatidylserine/phosphatidylglycerophosphate/cardiolipin synthase-like enzyme
MADSSRRRTSLAGLLLFLTFVWLALLLRRLPSEAGNPPPTAAGPGWYGLYFTQPAGPQARRFEGGPDEALAQAIEASRYSAEVAAYELDLWSVRDALIRAARRGVAVRVITDSDSLDAEVIGDLRSAGIPVRGDEREPLMHHKFVVLDRLEVWTGSMNFTVSGAYRSDNNLIRVRSAVLAQDYLREFEEMYTEQRFGALSRADTPFGSLLVEGVPLEVMFSPEDGVLARLLELVRGAQNSVHFLAFSFTSDELGESLLGLASSGVEVQGVMESAQAAGQGSEYERMRQSGLRVRLDGNPYTMHHKVLILDGRIVVTGSYNFSRSAEERNDENVLILFDPALAAAYEAEFQRVMAEARP